MWIVPYSFPYYRALLCYLITSPVPTCLVHNCEISRGLVDFHLLSPLFQDQIPFDSHQQVIEVGFQLYGQLKKSPHDGTGVLGSTAVSMVSQATRLGKGSSVMAQDECVP